MPTPGTLSHIDISVGYPERSIPFYHALLTGLGYRRMITEHPGFAGPNPERAWWSVRYQDGSHFGIEVRPADATPTDYSGQAGYSEGYYAVFVADPDGVKLEVVHLP